MFIGTHSAMTDGHYPRSYACIASDISIIQAQEDRSALSPLIIAWNIGTLWLCYSIGDSDVKVEWSNVMMVSHVNQERKCSANNCMSGKTILSKLVYISIIFKQVAHSKKSK